MKIDIELVCYEIRITTYFLLFTVYSSRELVNELKLGFKLNVYPHIFRENYLLGGYMNGCRDVTKSGRGVVFNSGFIGISAARNYRSFNRHSSGQMWKA